MRRLFDPETITACLICIPSLANPCQLYLFKFAPLPVSVMENWSLTTWVKPLLLLANTTHLRILKNALRYILVARLQVGASED